MLAIQILILLFCLFALITIWGQGKMTRLPAVLWTLFWIAVGVVVLRPEFTTLLAHLVGVGRGVDLVTYLALLLIFYLLLRLFTRLEELERDITGLVREIALERARLKDESKS